VVQAAVAFGFQVNGCADSEVDGEKRKRQEGEEEDQEQEEVEVEEEEEKEEDADVTPVQRAYTAVLKALHPGAADGGGGEGGAAAEAVAIRGAPTLWRVEALLALLDGAAAVETVG